MGRYFNVGNERFREAVNSSVYIDKTGMIYDANKLLCTNQKYLCVSRPRRFGKSITASMLVAYYSRGCDSKDLFQHLKIAKSDSFQKHLNQYDVISLNMQEFLSRSKSMGEMLERIGKLVMREIKKEYPDIDYFDDTDLIQSMQDVYEETRRPFVVVIDEWDCIFREYREKKQEQDEYLDLIRAK